jgi:PAS domain S-box-containing protein
MIPKGLIVLLDAVAAASLLTALILILARWRHFCGPVRILVLTSILVTLVVAQGNVLEWSGLLPQADIVEDFIEPFLPTLWLFLFVVELEQADRRRLAESEAKYRALVENAQVAIVFIDADRIIRFWNRGAERLHGWSAEEVLGRHISLIYPAAERARAEREILPVLARHGIWNGEFPATRKDGTAFIGFLSLSRIIDPQGRTLGTLGFHADVTDRVQLREQLIQAQKMETVGALAGGIAHDFNNLLTAILGFAGLLRTSLPQGTDDHDAAVNIENAATRGAQLARQLLTFSHKQPTKTEPVNVNHLVQETCDLIRRTFPRTIEVQARLASDLRLIRGDPTQMHQVIMNLAVNARDAMPKGGQLTLVTENLDLRADDPRGAGLSPGPCVCLTVTDTGQGIPPDVQPHVFEPFFTTKAPAGGTGLGLSTVYAIVMRHGGRITFRTRLDQGTTFYVVLPAATARPAGAPATHEPHPVDAP